MEKQFPPGGAEVKHHHFSDFRAETIWKVVNSVYFLPFLFLSRDSCINASTTQHSQQFVRRALDMPMGLKASSRGVGSDLHLQT